MPHRPRGGDCATARPVDAQFSHRPRPYGRKPRIIVTLVGRKSCTGLR